MKNKEKEKEQGSLIGRLSSAAATAGIGYVAVKNRKKLLDVAHVLGSETILKASHVLNKNSTGYRTARNVKDFLGATVASFGDNPTFRNMGRAVTSKAHMARRDMRFERNMRTRIQSRYDRRNLEGQNGSSHQIQKIYGMQSNPNTGHGLNPMEQQAMYRLIDQKFIDRAKGSEHIKNIGGESFIAAIGHYQNNIGKILDSPEDHIDDFVKKVFEDKTYKISLGEGVDQKNFQSKAKEILGPKIDYKKFIKENKGEIEQLGTQFQGATLFTLMAESLKEPKILDGVLSASGYQTTKLRHAENMSLAERRSLGFVIDTDEGGTRKSVDVVEGLSSYRQMGADGEVSPLHI
ncbi:MAG: hypothetical protein ACRC5C_12110, partial [Bacilli bacterium]